MQEILNKEEQMTPETENLPAVEPAEDKEKKRISKKKRRRNIRLLIILVIVALIAGLAYKFLGGKGGKKSKEMVVDVVQYGSITSKVDGSGMTKAKNSETITLTTPGTVMDVMVTEGQKVNQGDPLFVVDSPAARAAVEKARSDAEGYEKQLSAAMKDIAGLNLTPGYTGKLLETVKLNPGDTISKGQKVAVLADDTHMRLEQYYSYAYEGNIKVGQTVDVSIPALMSTVPGKVEAVHMVSRITPEGSKLFSVDISLKNEGALTAEMVASATTVVKGETVYPYEPSKLQYARVGDLCSTVSGTVISSKLVDYMQVKPGQVLVKIDGEDSESELFTIKQGLENAQKELETAEKNLANCRAVAPISGTVIGLSLTTGSEIPANTNAVTISDTDNLVITANVDERNVTYLKPGMMVNLDQWGTTAMGVVESVSLSSTVNNGVATYPMVISVDNTEGTVQINSNINYSVVASQNDNCLILPLQAVRTVGLEDGSMVTVVYVKGERPENALEVPDTGEEIPSGFWPVQVEIGIQDTTNVEIKSGVEEGTEVFTQMMTTEVWG